MIDPTMVRGRAENGTDRQVQRKEGSGGDGVAGEDDAHVLHMC